MEPTQNQPPADEQPPLPSLHGRGGSLLPRFIRAASNLLKLPLFALQTKGLRTLDGIECRGTVTRDHETYDFVLKATRNTATLYPGPLARKAHIAFLSIATEQTLPLANPISWGWRDLCRRMGIAGSGRDIQQLKSAIEATKGLLIKSHYALYSKPQQQPLRTHEEGLNLYDRYVFAGQELADGTVAEANYLWIASWYLDNLNAMFTAPLDYELWRWLDSKSPVASRLYEFLLLNFYSSAPKIRINYETLAQYLPVKPERYLSDAKRQLDPAFTLLGLVDVIASADWADSKSGLASIHLYRGPRLTGGTAHRLAAQNGGGEEMAGSFEVKELRNLKPPEWSVVTDFYRLWDGTEEHRPTAKELEQAREILGRFGPRKGKDVIVRVVKRLKKQWPEAKTFGAIQAYLADAARDFDRDEAYREQEQQEQLKRRRERDERTREEAEQIKFLAAWRPLWEGITEAERDAIAQAAFSGSNHCFRNGPQRIAERLCLTELARRQGAEIPAETAR